MKTAIKERGILLKADAVAAILEGRKTQARQVVKSAGAFGVGDILWVREAWRIVSWDCEGEIHVQCKDGANKEVDYSRTWGNYDDWCERMFIQSTEDCEQAGLEMDTEGMYFWDNDRPPTRWRHAVHMPRCCSRLDLEIVSVRQERLQDLTKEDAYREGFDSRSRLPTGGIAEATFVSLWDGFSDSIRRNYSWSANPLVWVIDFKANRELMR